MKKYFALDAASGDLRLRLVGEFECIGEAIEKADEKSNQVIWVLAEEDFQNLIYDYTHVMKKRFMENEEEKIMKINIRYISQELLEQYHNEFSLTSLALNALPASTAKIDGIPYTYHEIYAEILRRIETEKQ